LSYSDDLFKEITRRIWKAEKRARAKREKVSPLETPPSLPEAPEPTKIVITEQACAKTRKDFVLPILDEKGWSILDWANAAGVSHATAMDYLEEKTKPYRSSRSKLAKALGVDAAKLPK
jgi:lambda repressor-like predicted transcriptional regulator